jgi:hypothetical protein
MCLPLQRFWADDRGLSAFLTILALVTFVVFPLAGLGLLGRFLVDLVLSLMLVSGAVATSQNRIWQALIIILVVVGLTTHWIGAYVPSYEHPALDALLNHGVPGLLRSRDVETGVPTGTNHYASRPRCHRCLSAA